MPISSFDPTTAKTEGIKKNGVGFSLGMAGVFSKYFCAGFEYGGGMPGDNASFTNQTTAGKMSSSIYIHQFSVYTGLVTPEIQLAPNKKKYLLGTLSVGNMWAFLEERSIGNCIGCDREKLDIDGGLYVAPEIYLVFIKLGIGLGYRYFFNSDYKGRLELKLSVIF